MKKDYSHFIPGQFQLEAELCKKSLYDFVKHSFPIIEPGVEFKDGWHIQAVCDYLEACFTGDIKRLIINIPPRHMKSLITSVCFCPWVWLNKPSKKFLYASYSQELAVKDSVVCRGLLDSPWYKTLFPKVQISRTQNEKSFFVNRGGGHRQSIGVGGKGSGLGGNFLIADDLLNRNDVYSEKIREDTNQWFGTTFSTRLNNPKDDVIIIICQRLHESDIVGHIEATNQNYEKLILPEEYEPKRFFSSIGFTDPRKEVGELLWPEQFGKEEVEKLKISLGTEIDIACQLQQRPSTESGNIFDKKNFSIRVNNTSIYQRWQSWDTAASVSSKGSAYSACVTGEITNDYRLFIRDVWRGRVDFVDLVDKANELAEKWKYGLEYIFIENKSSGTSLGQTMIKGSAEWIKPLIKFVNPTSDKESRAHQSNVWVANGSILLPPHEDNYSWLGDFEAELFSFPQSRFKDQVDSFCQLVIRAENFLEEGFMERKNSRKEA